MESIYVISTVNKETILCDEILEDILVQGAFVPDATLDCFLGGKKLCFGFISAKIQMTKVIAAATVVTVSMWKQQKFSHRLECLRYIFE